MNRPRCRSGGRQSRAPCRRRRRGSALRGSGARAGAEADRTRAQKSPARGESRATRRGRRVRGSSVSCGGAEGGGHDDVRIGAAGQNRAQGAAAHHADAVAHADDFGEIAGDQNHGEALFCEAADDLVDLALGADVDALSGLVEDQELGLGREPAGEGNLLLIAAGEAAAAGFRTGAFDGEVTNVIQGERAFGAKAEPRRGEEAAVEEQVLVQIL